MTALLAILVCIIGALVYGLSQNPKISEMGRIAFFCGLLVALLQIGGQAVTLFR